MKEEKEPARKGGGKNVLGRRNGKCKGCEVGTTGQPVWLEPSSEVRGQKGQTHQNLIFMCVLKYT